LPDGAEDGRDDPIFFHVECVDSMHADEHEQQFSDLKDAKAQAARIARELAQEGSEYVGCWVCIADAQGNEWGRVSVGSDVD
jgi:hypothetical protein